MTKVGIRELRNQLSKYLRRVAEGERLVVTQRGEPIALLVPASPIEDEYTLRALVSSGAASWSGGKPRGAKRPIRARGGAVSDLITEDRR